MNANSQNSIITQQRLAIDAAISAIEDYAAYATISDDDVQYSFLNLFTSPKSIVYNDLLGVSFSNEITVEDYCKLLQRDLRNKNVIIKNIKKEEVSQEGKTWKIVMSFDKSISYVNECGTFFSNNDFYGKDYRLKATVVYDANEDKYAIDKITGTVDSEKKLSEDYFVFVSKDKRDQDLLVKSQRLKFNRYHQALLPGRKDLLTDQDFSYPDASIALKPQIDRCGVSMTYKIRRLRLRPYFEKGLGNVFSITSDASFSNMESSGSTFGLDFGYIFYSRKALSLGAYLGVGLTQSKMDLSYNNADYSFSTDVDVDGDRYTRHYENLSLEQTYKFSDLCVPVYLELGIQANKILAFYVDLGLKMNFNMKRDVDNTVGSTYVYGVYPQYNNLRLDEQWGGNGFGNKSFSTALLVNNELNDVTSFTASLMTGLGLRIGIPRTSLSIDAGVNYVMGINDFIAPSSAVQLGNNVTNSIVYPTLSDNTCTEHVRNLSEALSSVKRKSLKFHIGLLFKF